jgi:hypothetical protein
MTLKNSDTDFLAKNPDDATHLACSQEQRYQDNDIAWLLLTVGNCVEDSKCRKWGSSQYYIFKGSYDVWENDNDGVRFDGIMKARLNEAKDLGLIINESGNKEWKYNENWTLTELGKEQLAKIDIMKFRLVS